MDAAGLKVGHVLDGTYELVAPLGVGGMGVVYKAKHLRLPKFVAVKVLRGISAADPDIYKRFRREAEIASSLGHPNICGALDFNTLQDGSPYLVLEFLSGQSLRQRLEAEPIGIAETLLLISQVGAGLAAAHRREVVHRDLKPENVFLCAPQEGATEPVVKILDFGISKIHGGTSALTRDGALMGTPFYMAPEQAKGEAVDARTDQFALAVMVYEMLTGRLPFRGDQPMQVLFQVVHHEVMPPTSVAPHLPSFFDTVLLRALSKDREPRYPDVKSFIGALWTASGMTQPSSSLQALAASGTRHHASETSHHGATDPAALLQPGPSQRGPSPVESSELAATEAPLEFDGDSLAPTDHAPTDHAPTDHAPTDHAPTLGSDDLAYAQTATPADLADADPVGELSTGPLAYAQTATPGDLSIASAEGELSTGPMAYAQTATPGDLSIASAEGELSTGPLAYAQTATPEHVSSPHVRPGDKGPAASLGQASLGQAPGKRPGGLFANAPWKKSAAKNCERPRIPFALLAVIVAAGGGFSVYQLLGDSGSSQQTLTDSPGIPGSPTVKPAPATLPGAARVTTATAETRDRGGPKAPDADPKPHAVTVRPKTRTPPQPVTITSAPTLPRSKSDRTGRRRRATKTRTTQPATTKAPAPASKKPASASKKPATTKAPAPASKSEKAPTPIPSAFAWRVRQAWSALRRGDYRLGRDLGDRLLRDLPRAHRGVAHAIAAAAHCGLVELGSHRARMQLVSSPRLRRRVKAFCRRVAED